MKKEHWAGIQLAVRAGVAASGAMAVAQWLRLEHPIYAFIAAVIVTDLQPSESRRLGARRIAATVVGSGSGAMMSLLLPSGPIAVGVGIVVAMAACLPVGLREGAKVAGYICGIVLSDHGANPWRYALFRLAETIIGVLAAWAVSFVPKLLDRER